jgi:CRP/FNR family transcriptional regulator, cyclic AMP receptor protein
MYNPFRKAYSSEELSQFRLLNKAALLSKLSNDELSYFLPFLFPREYKQHEVVFFRGDPSQALYLIRSGVVALSLDVGTKTEPLSQRRAFQTLGENALLADSQRVYNAIVSSERAEIVVIPQANILEIFDQKPIIKAKMLEALAIHFNLFLTDLFYAYRSHEGFFELAQAYTVRNNV